jgi:hypothetical protein
MLVKGAELGLLIREPDVKILEHVVGFGARGWGSEDESEDGIMEKLWCFGVFIIELKLRITKCIPR